jgi:hypothetical protein
MPDITMCESVKCPLRETCYRNPASGTKADELRQSVFVLGAENSPTEDADCKHYWASNSSGAWLDRLDPNSF